MGGGVRVKVYKIGTVLIFNWNSYASKEALGCGTSRVRYLLECNNDSLSCAFGESGKLGFSLRVL